MALPRTDSQADEIFALALQQHQAGQLSEAERLYRRVLSVKSDHDEALHHLGLVAEQVGRHELAKELIARAIALRPNNPASHCNLGEIHRNMGCLQEAIASFQRALKIDPGSHNAHNNLGLALLSNGQPQEAEIEFRRVVQIQPDYAIGHYNLGISLAKQGQFDEAITGYRQALQFRPDYAEAWSNLGAALDGTERPGEAIAAYQHAIQLRPDYADAHCNLGSVLNDRGQYDEAMEAYDRALEIDPGHKCAAYNRSLLLLLHGHFERGWPLFKARWDALDRPERSLAQPQWEGGNVHGRRLLIYAEQGLGDSIHFIRYAPLLAEAGGEIIVECQPPLLELFRTVKGVKALVPLGESPPAVDAQISILDLPLAFKTVSESIPRNVPYLSIDSALREIWRERLGGDRSRLRVGLVWQGNRQHRRHRKRDISLSTLVPLLEVEGVDFFSLQMNRGREQIREVAGAAAIIDHTEAIGDFADTAALMGELDLILAVDTSVAHLAGALGRPVWTLLPFVPDWRWGLETEQSPWYPTMRLFRQPAIGDWDSVIQCVAEELVRAARDRSRLKNP